jgi:hypothetical protein
MRFLTLAFVLLSLVSTAQSGILRNQTMSCAFDTQVWKYTPSKDTAVWLDLHMVDSGFESGAPRFTIKARAVEKHDLKEDGTELKLILQRYNEAKIILDPMWIENGSQSYWQLLLQDYSNGQESVVNIRLYYHNGYLVEITEQGSYEAIDKFSAQFEDLRNSVAFR